MAKYDGYILQPNPDGKVKYFLAITENKLQETVTQIIGDCSLDASVIAVVPATAQSRARSKININEYQECKWLTRITPNRIRHYLESYAVPQYQTAKNGFLYEVKKSREMTDSENQIIKNIKDCGDREAQIRNHIRMAQCFYVMMRKTDLTQASMLRREYGAGDNVQMFCRTMLPGPFTSTNDYIQRTLMASAEISKAWKWASELLGYRVYVKGFTNDMGGYIIAHGNINIKIDHYVIEKLPNKKHGSEIIKELQQWNKKHSDTHTYGIVSADSDMMNILSAVVSDDINDSDLVTLFIPHDDIPTLAKLTVSPYYVAHLKESSQYSWEPGKGSLVIMLHEGLKSARNLFDGDKDFINYLTQGGQNG